MWPWLEQMTQNPFFSGGALLVVLGGLLAYFRNLPSKLWGLFERFFILKIEVLDDDEAYHWMRVWLAERMSRTLSISVCTRRKKGSDEDDEDAPGDNRPQVYFVPSPGTYFFLYRGRPVVLTRERDDQPSSTGTSSLTRIRESFRVRILSWDRRLAHDLVQQCRELALPQDGKVDVRIPCYSYWELGNRIRPRTLDSVILDGGQGEALKKDMQEFLRGHDWYARIGVPYRRGYLLHGEPGNGKTSLIKALASELNMSIYLLNLSMPDMTDSRLASLMMQIGDNSLVLMEDVDCAFVKRTRKGGSKEGAGGLTFSGLLNAIDGVASPEGLILCMTTNHRERLDPALIRPGRADVQVYIGNATREQARRLFSRFYPEAPAHLAARFAQALPERRLSMAALQGQLQHFKDAPEQALTGLDRLLAQPEPVVDAVASTERELRAVHGR